MGNVYLHRAADYLISDNELIAECVTKVALLTVVSIFSLASRYAPPTLLFLWVSLV